MTEQLPSHESVTPSEEQRTAEDIQALNERVREQHVFVDALLEETSKVIVGQKYMLERLLVGLLSKGHVLLEGLPGLAKTLAIKTLSTAIDADFQRIQFTPDLLPADIVGTMIFNPATSDFAVRKGPIFANFVLADEINRAPAKVQSALLEAMQERQVTIGAESFKLNEPFLVLATQNPIEQEGTYPLPEAQTDRFMLKCRITYPEMMDELQIMRMNATNDGFKKIKPVVKASQIIKARETVREIYMDESIEMYILDIVQATRDPKKYDLEDLVNLINYGGSPRASINLALASKAYAFLQGRGHVIPDDVREMCYDVMRHRIGLTYEAEAQDITPTQIIDRILGKIVAP